MLSPEALTLLPETGAPDDVYETMAGEFDPAIRPFDRPLARGGRALRCPLLGGRSEAAG